MEIVADLMKQEVTGDNLSMISKSVGGDGKAVQSALGMGMPPPPRLYGDDGIKTRRG